MKAIHIRVTGRVQGVFFRAGTKRQALALNLTGWVKNTPDGAVEAAFEGEDGRIQEILVWCSTGPPGAFVEKLECSEAPYTGRFSDFAIR
ncbi:MAG: acylphosphatase [Smithellaceae bacterium]|nr:acylphosphatase [Smithellaceae bacterium]